MLNLVSHVSCSEIFGVFDNPKFSCHVINLLSEETSSQHNAHKIQEKYKDVGPAILL